MNSTEEKERLEALKSYNILDSPPDAMLDNITALASYICKTPNSLISLLDNTRQWFMSSHGLDVKETSREIAFCNYAIEQAELFEVEDTLQDKRFEQNPLVTESPFIRFYAGYPIINNEGYALGTLCVVDKKPRKLTNEQRQAIKHLSKMVMVYIETNRQQNYLSQSIKMHKEFVNDMNYEMRTPLNAILGLSSLLTEKNQDRRLNDDLEMLNKSAEDVVNILNELTEANRSNIEFPPKIFTFSLNTLLTDLIADVSTSSNVNIKLVYDFGLPDLVEGDLSGIRQLLRHLLYFQMMGRQEAQLHLITESVEKVGHRVKIRFEVVDQIGNTSLDDSRYLLKQKLEKDIAVNLAKSLDGEFFCEPHQKSVELNFNVPNITSQAPKTISTEEKSIKGLNLLLVEDMETNQKIAAKFLEMWGVNFDIANNGQEAIEAVLQKDYDVILMDMRMPVMDGYDAVKRIKAMKGGRYKNLPIIALTASVSSPMEEKVKNLELAGFITKPFNPNELKFKIARSIQAKHPIA